jgi:hypothetical protein
MVEAERLGFLAQRRDLRRDLGGGDDAVAVFGHADGGGLAEARARMVLDILNFSTTYVSRSSGGPPQWRERHRVVLIDGSAQPGFSLHYYQHHRLGGEARNINARFAADSEGLLMARSCLSELV